MTQCSHAELLPLCLQCRLVQCSSVNSVADCSCKACGAARWDGKGGQLAARVRAILQASACLFKTVTYPITMVTAVVSDT